MRMHWCHEELSLRMLLAYLGHHSQQIKATVDVQTVAVPDFFQMSEEGSVGVQEGEAVGVDVAVVPLERVSERIETLVHQERVQRRTVELGLGPGVPPEHASEKILDLFFVSMETLVPHEREGRYRERAGDDPKSRPRRGVHAGGRDRGERPRAQDDPGSADRVGPRIARGTKEVH